MAGIQTQLNLKLLVDTKANKVLFAEAGKEFVDFIFHIMSLPLGTVVKLLTEKNVVGCLGDLYKSAESLNAQYFNSDNSKDSVLNPKTAVEVPLLSLYETPTTTDAPKQFYSCGSCSNSSITDNEGFGMKCPNCSYGTMNSSMNFVKPTTSSTNTTPSSSGLSGGYVKGVVTYMLMDNLEVKPMSTISGITLINKFHVKDVSSLEEKEVLVGFKEGLAILKASLETKAVLTSVFLIGTKI